MSEHLPPGWEDDPDAGDLDNEDLDNEDWGSENLAIEDLVQLAEVTAVLASAPPPVLPDALVARISAAIAAEAATRTEHTGASGVMATARSLSPDDLPAADRGEATTAPPASSRRSGPRRGTRRAATSPATGPAGTRPARRGRRGFRPLPAIGSLAVCLVLAGFGYLVARNTSSPGPTMSSAAAPAAEASASASTFRAASGSAGAAAAPQPAGNDERSSAGQGPGFPVSRTGTRYEAATLAGQVRAALTAIGDGSPSKVAPTASAGGTGSLSNGVSAASAALAGCVDRLTHNQVPGLVDRATYAGKPAYIIAVPRRAWVVGLGCTAANPELITSVALAGLSGNLRALGSV